MKGRVVYIFLCWWLSSGALPCSAQLADGQEVVSDLRTNWLVFNPDIESYQPYGIADANHDQNTVSFFLNTQKNKYFRLMVGIQGNSTMLVNGQVARWFDNPGTHYFDLDSLNDHYVADSLLVTFYNPALNVAELNTVLVGQNIFLQKNFIDRNFKVESRENRYFDSFFFMGLLVIMAIYAFVVYSYPKAFFEFHKLWPAVSPRRRDEPMYNLRALGTANLYIYAASSAVLAFVLVVFGHFLADRFSLFQYLVHNSFQQAAWQWVKALVVVFSAVLLRSVLVYAFVALYKLSEVWSIHFYSAVRLFNLMVLAMLFTVVVFYLLFQIQQASAYASLVYAGLALLFARLLILFFKLLNTTSHRILYLFSYLCGTEIVPIIVTIKIVL